MRKLLVAVLALTALVFTAQAQTKIAVVDFADLYDNYYKVADTKKKFESNRTNLQEQVDLEMQKLEQLAQEIQQLEEEAQNEMLFSEEARAEKAQQAQQKRQEGQQIQAKLRRWDQDFQREFMEQRNQLIKEVSEVVGEVAKEQGYDLVLDNGGDQRAGGLGAVVYSVNTLDITSAVRRKLEATAPQN